MALGKKNQDQAAESVTLEPQDAYDQAVISVAAWLQELKSRRAVLEEAEHELRVAGKYPPANLFGGLFDVCDRVEMSALHARPELFGGLPRESRERGNVRQARSNVAHAQEHFDALKAKLEGWQYEQGEEVKRVWLGQLGDWSRTLAQYRHHLAGCLRACPDLTAAERREVLDLIAQPETVTISI